MSGFSVNRQEKSQIGDSCDNSEFVTATGGRSTPPFQRSLLNITRRLFTGFSECLCHQPLWKITHHGSGNLNLGAWWLVQDLLTSFGRSNNLYNHMDVYLILLGGQVTISSWILWVHGEVFKCAEIFVTVNRQFLSCWCLCEIYFPCQILLLTKKCKYPEVCFKGCKIHLWKQFLFSMSVIVSRYAITMVNNMMIYQP